MKKSPGGASTPRSMAKEVRSLTERSLAQSSRTKKERVLRESGEQEEQERQGGRDHLYEALAAMPMEERLATINRMAERMGV